MKYVCKNRNHAVLTIDVTGALRECEPALNSANVSSNA